MNLGLFALRAWTGGSAPPARLSPPMRQLARFLFVDQAVTWARYWGTYGTYPMVPLEQARIFWRRARADAWATLRAEGGAVHPDLVLTIALACAIGAALVYVARL